MSVSTSTSSIPQHRILLVDDDPEIHDLVSGILKVRHVELLSAMNGVQAIEIALRDSPDLILLDYSLPGANGLEILKALRSSGVPDSVPIIFITGNDSHKILTDCFRAGAADYIRKPFCIPELLARVGSVLDRMRILRQLEIQALFDPLTHLFNRASIRSKIQAVIESQSASKCGVLFLDFDRFKLINDSLGHNIGDQLLEQIAVRMLNALDVKNSLGYFSKQSAAARLGGDEFVILLDELHSPGDALKVADRILGMLEEPYTVSGHRINCSASIGVINAISDYQHADDVLRDADIAMYEAKFSGKGRYVVFDKAMHVNAEQRLQLENDLRDAIVHNEFFLVYQPIISLESGRCEGFEALIRWNHPQRGLISPIDFLPAASESGLIVSIDNWVLDQACKDFANWQLTLGDSAPTRIHVNVSRKHLLRNLIGQVECVLDTYSMSAECLHVEVTESEIMQDPEIAKETLNQLRRRGIKVDMDDFGTGHSSLACLQELPIDVLKIDRSFVANMERDRSFAALVHAVITLGQNMDIKVIAEGIETAEQLAMLQAMECEYGQGYYISKPMPVEEVALFMISNSRSEQIAIC